MVLDVVFFFDFGYLISIIRFWIKGTLSESYSFFQRNYISIALICVQTLNFSKENFFPKFFSKRDIQISCQMLQDQNPLRMGSYIKIDKKFWISVQFYLFPIVLIKVCIQWLKFRQKVEKGSFLNKVLCWPKSIFAKKSILVNIEKRYAKPVFSIFFIT